jgi:hypothetical protein
VEILQAWGCLAAEGEKLLVLIAFLKIVDREKLFDI